MRFVLAIVLFVVAFVSIGLGIAQRTVLLGPDSASLEVATAGTAPITVIDGAALNAMPGTQGITLESAGPIFLAYGRTADVLGWVGDASYSLVDYDADSGELTATEHRGTEQTVPTPAGSDLWLQEFTGEDRLVRRIHAPTDVSAIVVADGTVPAPSRVQLSWPLDNETPWAAPLVIGGLVLLAGGLLVFVWALVHARRGRGPRRKTPKLPRPPRPPQLKPSRMRRALPAAPTPARGRRRAFTALGALAVGAVALTGCTVSSDDALARQSTPTPTATAPADGDDAPPPAVTGPQFRRHILPDVLKVVAQADADRDATLAATRLDGPALRLRTANYALLGIDGSLTPVAPFPEGEVRTILPQQTDSWPRTVFAVIQPTDETVAPLALVLVQNTARENYKVEYAVNLEPDVKINVALTDVGAPLQFPDNKLGRMQPDQIAAAYGDLLIKGGESSYASVFESEGDSLQASIGSDKKKERAAGYLPTAQMTFSNAAGPGPVIAFGTTDAGQIVAVELDDVETVVPAEVGAAINPSGGVKALSGKTQTTRGIVATYGLQLLFYVPSVTDTTAKIQLLGFDQGLIEAHEVG